MPRLNPDTRVVQIKLKEKDLTLFEELQNETGIRSKSDVLRAALHALKRERHALAAMTRHIPTGTEG